MSTKVVIASMLKPVDDVRAYWKIAQSLAKTNKYELNIIGNVGKKQADNEKIHFHQHSVLPKQKVKRLFLRYAILVKILQIRPQLLIISTHELLFAALLIKWIIGIKIIYDIQENYSANARMNPGPFYRMISDWIRCKEQIIAPFIDQFWLAEQCYQKELGFIRNKYLVLQNKALKTTIKDRKKGPLRMLFSGTISTYAGAEYAASLMKQLLKEEQSREGVFIGQIHDQDLEKKLLDAAKQYPNLALHLSRYPVPYNEILDRIQWANIGLITYQPNSVNQDKVPTKLFEYSRYKLPYLIQVNTSWAKLGRELGGAIPIDFTQLNHLQIGEDLLHTKKLFPEIYLDTYTWENEASKVIDNINSLIKKI